MSRRGKGNSEFTIITDKETFIPLFSLILLFSIILGFLDWGSNGWSTSFLNPAAATPTILALVLISFMPKRPSKIYKSLLEASLWSSLILHIAHLLSLYLFFVSGVYLGVAYIESRNLYGNTYSVLSISPVILMLVYYYRDLIFMKIKGLLKR